MPRLFMGPHAIGIFASKLFGHFIIAGDTFNAFLTFHQFFKQFPISQVSQFLIPDSVNADPVKRQDGASGALSPNLAGPVILLAGLSFFVS